MCVHACVRVCVCVCVCMCVYCAGVETAWLVKLRCRHVEACAHNRHRHANGGGLPVLRVFDVICAWVGVSRALCAATHTTLAQCLLLAPRTQIYSPSAWAHARTLELLQDLGAAAGAAGEPSALAAAHESTLWQGRHGCARQAGQRRRRRRRGAGRGRGAGRRGR